MNITFFLRKSRSQESLLYARIYSSRTIYVDFSLNFKTDNLEAYQTQQRIRVVEPRLQDIINELIAEGVCHPKVVRDRYLQKQNSEQLTIKNLFTKWVTHQKDRSRWGEIKPITIKRHLATQTYVDLFTAQPGNNRILPLIDLEWLKKFEGFLKDRVAVNTAMTHIKHIRRALLFAVENKLINHYPFQGYRAKWQPTERGFLTQEELDKIESHDFGLQRLNNVRDVFVFQCYTGISFSDLSSMIIDNDGKTVGGTRIKTGMQYVVPLLLKPKNILQKYGGKLPIYSNQKTNGYLQELATICHIEKHLTTHLARHTFATTVLLENKIPLQLVAKMLGHNSVRSTEVYGKVLKSQVLQVADELERRYQ